MINVDRNQNFSEWYDIRLFGKLIDNARSFAKAMAIAKAIQKEHNLGIFACPSSKKEIQSQTL